ncbi:hypothetical protein MARI151_30330 [Maribacter litoralis]|uniref:Uncharacterized protein n=1 Tax=Maribacter litoralis TaxID=2059726 RepID=A0A653SKR9_9FLAO|nr:hypothetical protein MARI151_30330 [Maribacter litoralis]
MARVIPKNVQFIAIALVEYSKSKPTQLIGGPGKTGKKLPKMPTSIKRNPRTNKNISIVNSKYCL